MSGLTWRRTRKVVAAVAMVASLVGVSRCGGNNTWSCNVKYQRSSGFTLLAKDAFGTWNPSSIGTADIEHGPSQSNAEDTCEAKVNGHVASSLTGGNVNCTCFSASAANTAASPSGFPRLK